MVAEERPALQPLPVEPFRSYQFGTRRVHLDGAVEVDYAYYPAPPGWLGHQVAVQWDGIHVRLLDPATGMLLREHRCQAPGRRASAPEDRPARTPPTTLTLLAQAARAGTHIGTLCTAIHRHDGEAGVRRILGVLRDLRKRGNFDRLGRPLLFAGAQWDASTAAYVDRRNGLRAPRICLSGPLIQIEARKP